MICLSSAGSLASFDGGARKKGRRRTLLVGWDRAPRRKRTAADDNRRKKRESPLLSTPAAAQRLRAPRGVTAPSLSRRAPRIATRTNGQLGQADEAAPRGVEAPLEDTCSQAELASAICVQRFDDSLNSAIRTTYRISLRSSSLREPRHPLLKVVSWFKSCGGRFARCYGA